MMNGSNKVECHLFRKAALVELQIRTNNDDRTTGVVDTLTEKILTETTAFALEHIAEGFQRPVVAPVTARPRRPLSKSASTASCSMRFSFRTYITAREFEKSA